MSSDLAGKVAIVTGGASGIGRAGVAALIGAGAAVAVLDRDEGGVNAVVDQGKKSGGKALGLIADLAHTKSIPEAVAKVLEQFGHIGFVIDRTGNYVWAAALAGAAAITGFLVVLPLSRRTVITLH